MEREDQNASEISDLKERFDRHLVIYANNGKEMAGMKQELAFHNQALVTLGKALEENSKQTREMYNLLTMSRNWKDLIVLVFRLTLASGSLVGVYFAWRHFISD